MSSFAASAASARRWRRDLRAGGHRFVILERDEATAAHIRHLGYLCVVATRPMPKPCATPAYARAQPGDRAVQRRRQRVHHARARSLNPALEIIARGELPDRNEAAAGGCQQGRAADPYRRRTDRRNAAVSGDRALHPRIARMRDFERCCTSLGLELEVVTAAPGQPDRRPDYRTGRATGQWRFFIVQLNRPGGRGDHSIRTAPPRSRPATAW